ncbi:MAG TPA: hypothetical protein VGA92_09905 [Candidatus Nitrosotenuis sp.]|jgi:hypothetical protein
MTNRSAISHNENTKGNADRILSVVMGQNFPDRELAENIRQASEERRKHFKIRK